MNIKTIIKAKIASLGLAILSLINTGNAFAGIQISESFTEPSFPTASYSHGDFSLSSGTWNVSYVMGLNSLNAYNSAGGAVRFNRYTGAYLTTPELNGVGSLSFYYKNYSSLVGGGSFTVQKSIDNGEFTDIETISFTNTEEYTLFTLDLYELSSNVQIRIITPDTNTGFLCVDEVVITDFGQTLIANPAIVENLNYNESEGPSEASVFYVFGENLSGAPGNITLIAPANFEISLDGNSYNNQISIPYNSADLDYTPVYVRLTSGLSIGDYNNEEIIISGGGASDFYVSCNGSVTNTPTPDLNVSTSSLSGFNYTFGAGPSGIQSYNLSGTSLSDAPGEIVIDAPENYELSLDYSNYSQSLVISYSSDILISTVIYVRLKSGLNAGSYNSEMIVNSGGGAMVSVSCNGSVNPPPAPLLDISSTTLSGFSYVFGNGPSNEQTYTLSGDNLTGYPGNITVTAPSNFEISLNSGSGFTESLFIPYSSSSFTDQIFVRLKSGLTEGNYNNELISHNGGGADEIIMSCNGTVEAVPPPELSQSVSSLSGFTYIFGNGPSAEQFYTLNGENLTNYPGNITIAAPANYEVSLSSESGFSESISVQYNEASFSDQIYVRLKSGLAEGNYNGEQISHSVSDADETYISCNGSVEAVPPPQLTLSASSLSGFTYIFGDGPSAEQTFTINGANLTGFPGNIIVTAPENYEVSLSSESGYSTTLTIEYTSAYLSSTTIHVRLKAELLTGTYISELITITGGGADSVNLSCNGEVSEVPPATLSVNTTSLSGFNYTTGSGPSTAQAYNLSGTYLTDYPNNINITSSANFEISLNSESGFTNSLNIPYTTSTLTSTSIYVRLKSGLTVGTYNSEIITNTGGGAANVEVICSGTVSEVSDAPCLTEDFSGFTSGSHSTPGSTDLSGSLNTYTQTSGWNGYKIFSAGGEIKLGSSSAAGYIITPTIDLSAGGTIEFDYAKYGSDNGQIQVFHAVDGLNFEQVGSDINPSSDFQNQTIEIINGSSNSKIKIGSTNKRFYLDNIELFCGEQIPDPILISDFSQLNGFSYLFGEGPSESQSISISGTDLNGADLVINPSENYEISLSEFSTYQSSQIIVPSYTGDNLNIYIRLKEGLAASDYNNETISISCGESNQIIITCNGFVEDNVSINISDHDSGIYLAPNPASNQTQIYASNSKANLYIISIFDAQGKVLNSLTWNNPAESEFKLDLEKYPSGLYYVRIYNETEYHSLKLIIE